MTRLATSILAACLLLGCPPIPNPVPPGPDSGTGGMVATGGNPSTGGDASTGGAVDTGGQAATGGTTIAIPWPECTKIKKVGPVVRHRLGRRVTPKRMRTVQPWHATGVRVQSVLWQPNCTPALVGKPPCTAYDQDGIGMCTIGAVFGELSAQPFQFAISNSLMVMWYIWETNNDPFDGAYPQVDTGSDGNSAMKTAIHFGYIKSYTNANTLADMHAAIQSRGGIFGSDWTTEMDEPDRCGQIHVGGNVRGGHEYSYLGFDKERGREWFRTSWPGFGLNGWFFISSDETQTLIDDGADADFADVN